MALLKDLLTWSSSPKIPEPKEINGVPVKIIEVGVPGTQIYGGYLNEDYLGQLHGRHWADVQDQMRRSDAQIRMMLNCIKLPVRSGEWKIKINTDISEDQKAEAEQQKKLYEKILFRDIGKSFKRLIGEVLTCVDFGYSLFEITHDVKLNDPEIGTYNTVKSIAWRSQRTIERWKVDRDGNLEWVMQIAYGDTGRLTQLDSRFLLHFAPDMEGDNFEGISTLRHIYGNWIRKNHYLKLMASGIEKCAVPTPILEIPTGKEASPEFIAAKKVLEAYTSNQSNYITIPQGWALKVQEMSFDVEKMRTALDFENHEMMNAALASFLLLGQNKGSGSRALSNDLSDFFKMSQQYLADHISEQFDRRVWQNLLEMNFGSGTVSLVHLECDGLAENADVSWSEILKNLTDSGIIKADKELEKFTRDDFGLPPIDEETSSEYVQNKPTAQMSEKKSPKIDRETLKKGFMNLKMS